MISDNANLRKSVIHKLISTALYCLNLKNEKEQETVEFFLNAFLGMQGPEFFYQLEDSLNEKAYAGALCDVWHLFQQRQETIQVAFFDHPYQEGQTFVTVLSEDCDFITKTIQHFLGKAKIKYKNLMHPVVQVKRDNDGNLEHLFDGKWASDLEDESVVHFLVTQTLSNEEKEILKNNIIEAYGELSLIYKNKASIIKKLYETTETFQENQEERIFLEWLMSGKYYFYGYRYCTPINETTHSLGLFQKEEYQKHLFLTPEFQDRSVNVYKSALRSNINRASRYDCIEIPVKNQDGKNVGLHQFIGVFTPDFFASSPLESPLARLKSKKIMDHFGFNPRWYNSRLLHTIMNSISLDLFFHLEHDEIANLCQRVLEMQRDIVVFLKPQKDDEYIILLTFMPSDKYSYTLKETLKRYFEKTLKGAIYSEHVQISEDPFTRIVFVVDRNVQDLLPITLVQIYEEVNQLGQSWDEKLAKVASFQDVEMISNLFPIEYKKAFEPSVSLIDYHACQKVSDTNPIVFNILDVNQKIQLHATSKKESIQLSEFLPVLDDFGLKINAQDVYSLKDGSLSVFDVTYKSDVPLATFKDKFLKTLTIAYAKSSKRDRLHQLIVTTQLHNRSLLMIRSMIKMLKQIGFSYAYDYIVDVLRAHADFTEKFVECFTLKFDPEQTDESAYASAYQSLVTYCHGLTKLDDERILKAFLNLLDAAVRTNYYQGKDYISIKYASRKIENLPKPAPLYEIFVYSYTMEGVHLRSGKVARGGIRWSDRFEDFRFEILGLVKAQTVKNSVIVPLGSKGGFVVKRYEQAKAEGALNDTLKALVVSAYQTFISGLLDITDNLKDGLIIKPKQCVCHDEDDPYLVVAADKGTATFSDTANALSFQYDFWLGDAFASGGSKGYDHKKMAITARGAWICVQQHFKEMGIDVQKAPFTVVGVGDMAGDVFGNGMLQSDKIRLIGAFNHEHIFLDPNPDNITSFKERERLFNLPGSKWTDYNPDLISDGGGVYSRFAKSIPLSEDMQKILQTDALSLSPDAVIKLLLKSPVDLLFFGGIGTFVKSVAQSDADAKDRVNDLLRINGCDIQAKVVGEGANLGMTQLARIEYALSGGRVNMDAVDNSAGVDCSDHEVNIKILFNLFLQKGLLTLQNRDAILMDMTDNVADLVLQDNRQQAFLLSVLEKTVTRYESDYISLMDTMKNDHHLPLDAAVEYLPTETDLRIRHAKNQSFTRPELAILMSYAKLHLYQKLLESDLSYDDCLVQYFPTKMVEFYKDELIQHPLKKEIVSTYVANYLINRCGIHFIQSIKNTLHVDDVTVVKAFLKCVDLFGLDAVWQQALTLPTAHEQYAEWIRIADQLQNIVVSYLRNEKALSQIPVDIQKEHLKKLISSFNDLNFAPLVLYMASRSKCVDCLTTGCTSTYDVLDLAYLLELSVPVATQDAFESITLCFLSDQMLKTLVNVMCTFKSIKDPSVIENYVIAKNISKLQKRPLEEIAYMTQQLMFLHFEKI